MAVESSTLRLPLGSALPSIELPDLDGEPRHLPELRGDGILVVVFACNHCPYVKHVERPLGALATEFAGADVRFVAICSNDVDSYPDDDVPGLRDQQTRAGWTFPYLVDANQHAATTFKAACTPDLFAYDRAGLLAYRGAFDGSTPGNAVPVTGDLLRAALRLLLADQSVPEPHKPAVGCGIKWLRSNAPN